LADAADAVFDMGEFAVVLGGDCTILLGPMLALRRRGRYGLLFIDGHADFFQPEAEPNGEGASMELAWVTGHGPARVAEYEGFCPLVRDEDVIAMGYRDHEDQQKSGSQALPTALAAYDLPALRRIGIDTAAADAVSRLSRADLDGFFIHLDADVLNDDIMPAVDFRIPGGLSWNELVLTLQIAMASGRAVGLEVTIYNPDLDPHSDCGRGLVDALSRALGRG
jgi:arginase